MDSAADPQIARNNRTLLERIGAIKQKYPWETILALITCLWAMLYALITNHIWEDFFITFRHSCNLVNGAGLVFNAGERVQGFTSVINTLLPAFFYWICGGSSYGPALWLYRVVSAGALAASVWIILQLFASAFPTDAKTHLRNSIRLLFIAYLLFCVNTIAFAVNGQETAFMTLFLAINLHLLINGFTRRWLIGGVVWAALLYTRPDAPVYIAISSLVGLVFVPPETSRSKLMLAYIKAGLVCTLVYSPWFIWTWCYYGNPVPHSALAKMVKMTPRSYPAWQLPLHVAQSTLPALAMGFRPINAFFGGWPLWMEPTTLIIATIAATLWAVKGLPRVVRIMSLSFLLQGFYLGYMMQRGRLCSWYLPYTAFWGAAVLAWLPLVLGRTRCFSKWLSIFRYIPSLFFVGIFLTTYILGTLQIRIQQREIEFGTRADVGRWLHDRVAPGETVYLECLGYIGFFSNAHMTDYPGLASPRVRKLRKEKQLSFTETILAIKPEWLVLRPWEADALATLIAGNNAPLKYLQVASFDARPRLERSRFLPGPPYVYYDARFQVLLRQDIYANRFQMKKE